MDTDATIKELQDVLAKAAVINSTYSFSPATRSIFAPENLDPQVKLLVPTDTPLRNLLPRTQGYGQAAAWKKLTSQLNPDFANEVLYAGTGVSGFFADAGQPGQTTQTYSVVTAAYKNIGRDVEIGRQAIASSRGYEDIRDQQVKIKMLECMLAEEEAIINGDSSSDTNAFDGLIKQMTTNSGTMSYLTASGIGSQLSSPFVQYGADPDILVCMPRQVRALADDLTGSGSIQRVVVANQEGATGGVHLSNVVNPVTGKLIRIVTSRYMNTWALLLTLKSAAGENYIEMEDLEPLSVYEPPTANHSIISRVYETTVLKLINDVVQVKIGGLQAS